MLHLGGKTQSLFDYANENSKVIDAKSGERVSILGANVDSAVEEFGLSLARNCSLNSNRYENLQKEIQTQYHGRGGKNGQLWLF